MYFLIDLDGKTIKDCDGAGIELKKKVLNFDISWFPIGRSIILGNF